MKKATPTKTVFDFYLHSKDEVSRGACFSSQKHKLLEETSKPGDDNQ